MDIKNIYLIFESKFTPHTYEETKTNQYELVHILVHLGSRCCGDV
jgi:hypothetical protein